ncbi:MAG: MFS transporter [Magnetovibrionaceae bacterium]
MSSNGALTGSIAITFTAMVGLGLVYALLPFQAMGLGATPLLVTALLATDTLAIVLSAPVLGAMSDRWGRRKVLLLALSAGPLAYLAMAFAEGLALLFFSRILAGVANAGVSVIQAHLADVTLPEQRSSAMAGINACFGLAFVVGPLLAIATLGPDGDNYQTAAFAAFGASLISVLLAWFLVRPGFVEETGKPEVKGPITLRPLLLLALPLFALLAFAFAYEAQVTTVGLWGETRLGWGAEETSMAFMAAGVAAVMAWPIMNLRPLKALGDRTLVLGSGLFLVFGLSAFSGWFGPLATEAAITVMALNGFSILIGLSALQGHLSKSTPAALQGRILGTAHALASAARIAGPLWAGLAFEVLGPGWPSLSGAVLLALCLAVFALAPARLPVPAALSPRRSRM